IARPTQRSPRNRTPTADHHRAVRHETLPQPRETSSRGNRPQRRCRSPPDRFKLAHAPHAHSNRLIDTLSARNHCAENPRSSAQPASSTVLHRLVKNRLLEPPRTCLTVQPDGSYKQTSAAPIV